MDMRGSNTEKNLIAAFAGESQARNRYTYSASVAKKEGYEQISAFFIETADNEKEHAKVFFKLLGGPAEAKVEASYPVGIGDTKANLKAAAEGENMEWTNLYPSFAETAKKEGFEEVARAFDEISEVEKEHEARYLKLLENVNTGKVFSRVNAVRWKCNNCGRIIEAKEAPEKCPTCDHSKSYFEIACENY